MPPGHTYAGTGSGGRDEEENDVAVLMDEDLLASVENDKPLPCDPVIGSDSSSHRSFSFLVPLNKPHADGTYVQADMTLDSGAQGTYMAAELAQMYAERCPGAILSRTQYKKPQVTRAANESQMKRLGSLKIKGIVRDRHGQDHEFVRTFEILDQCILQIIYGLKDQSEDQGFPDLHAQASSATMTKEHYVIRHPHPVHIPLFRRNNHLQLSF